MKEERDNALNSEISCSCPEKDSVIKSIVPEISEVVKNEQTYDENNHEMEEQDINKDEGQSSQIFYEKFESLKAERVKKRRKTMGLDHAF